MSNDYRPELITNYMSNDYRPFSEPQESYRRRRRGEEQEAENKKEGLNFPITKVKSTERLLFLFTVINQISKIYKRVIASSVGRY